MRHIVVGVNIEIVLVLIGADICAEHLIDIEPCFHVEVQLMPGHFFDIIAEADVLRSEFALTLQDALLLFEPALFIEIIRVQIIIFAFHRRVLLFLAEL